MKIFALAAGLALSATAAVAESQLGTPTFTDYSLSYVADPNYPTNGPVVGLADLGYRNGAWQYFIAGGARSQGVLTQSYLQLGFGYDLFANLTLSALAEYNSVSVRPQGYAPEPFINAILALDYDSGAFGIGSTVVFDPTNTNIGWGDIYGYYPLGNDASLNFIHGFSLSSDYHDTQVSYANWNGLFGYNLVAGTNGHNAAFGGNVHRAFTSQFSGLFGLSGYNNGTDTYATLQLGGLYQFDDTNRLQLIWNRYGANTGSPRDMIEFSYAHRFGADRYLERRVQENVFGPYALPVYIGPA